ncbi:MAG: YkgJ family cysteine cluster protein [Myxococcales bacterium]|nr:YkgJ family cysteine cluster protein [Myxococcales bacterium]
MTVDATKVERLRQHDWGDDPFVALRGEGDEFSIKLVDGKCFFLDADKRCRIHSELGYEEKPDGCKAFPLRMARVGGEMRARLSFWCPTVSDDEGKPLRDQMRWVRATAKAAGDVDRKEKLTLDDELELTLRDVEAIEAPLLTLLDDESAAHADRLAAAAALLAELSKALEEKGKKALRAELERLAKDGLAALAERGRAGGRAARAGPVLSLFLGADGGRGALSRVGRFFVVRGFNLGVSALRSRVMGGAKASWRQIRAVKLEQSESSAALLTRYLTSKVRSRRYLMGEASVIGGVNLLVAAYAVINVLARLKAASEGRAATSAADVREAVQAADLLVVEHTALYRGPMFTALVETVLADPTLCASVLARLES